MNRRVRRGRRRSERRQNRPGRGTLSSKHRKLARKKAAAEGSRRERKTREARHNRLHPWDFGARGPRRATGKFPMVERRTSVNRSPCGRRTSLLAAREGAQPCRQYTRIGQTIPPDVHGCRSSGHDCRFYIRRRAWMSRRTFARFNRAKCPDRCQGSWPFRRFQRRAGNTAAILLVC